jgi:hypothetical protein
MSKVSRSLPRRLGRRREDLDLDIQVRKSLNAQDCQRRLLRLMDLNSLPLQRP